MHCGQQIIQLHRTTIGVGDTKIFIVAINEITKVFNYIKSTICFVPLDFLLRFIFACSNLNPHNEAHVLPFAFQLFTIRIQSISLFPQLVLYDPTHPRGLSAPSGVSIRLCFKVKRRYDLIAIVMVKNILAFTSVLMSGLRNYF